MHADSTDIGGRRTLQLRQQSGGCRVSPAPEPPGAGPVRPGFGFDAERLDEYLRQRLPDYAGPLSVSQFEGGQSNPTYLLSTPARRYVLRRKPPGQLLPSAHAVEREFRVISALGASTNVPVPAALLLCEEPEVVGTPFYLMDWVAGRMLRDPAFPEVQAAARPAHSVAIVDALARLHQVNLVSAGLEDFGRHGSYVARQFARWSRQYLGDEAAGRVEAMDRLVEWLPTRMPAAETTCVVHGDFRCDNLVFHPSEPRVLAILDWELATLGDPLADFAYYLMVYRMPEAGVPGLAGLDLAALNLPAEEACVEAYCLRTGRSGIADLDFYIAFNLFKLAAVLHGIRGRVLRGTAAGARARHFAEKVEPLAELAWQQAERAMRS
jgi:aminoglycoside phosphotransferase (APT) family kinase protein